MKKSSQHREIGSITDIIGVLTDSSNPRRYWSDLKTQLAENGGFD